MQHDDILTTNQALDPDHTPETITNRENEQTSLANALTDRGPQHRYIHIHGPRGTGKTLLVRTTIESLPQDTTTCYIPCTTARTQYLVLQQIYTRLTGEDIASGYQTAQLQRRVENLIADREVVLILDEIDFLLTNDGNDLLYFLSRMAPSDNLTVIAISSNTSDPAAVMDERTLSSLQPWIIPFKPYTEREAQQILEERIEAASLSESITPDALDTIVTTTRNIRLCLHWLEYAVATAEERITEDLLHNIRHAAVQRYQDTLLNSFSSHHQLLLEAISQITTEQNGATNTGPVYERYKDLCWNTEKDPLSHRRATDFLEDLEILGIIDINHHRGGKHGRTREIRLTRPLD